LASGAIVGGGGRAGRALEHNVVNPELGVGFTYNGAIIRVPFFKSNAVHEANAGDGMVNGKAGTCAQPLDAAVGMLVAPSLDEQCRGCRSD